MQHSLYSGIEPINNDQRKQKILSSFFDKNWKPFQLVQVRSVITLLLAECVERDLRTYLNEKMQKWEENTIEKFLIELEAIRNGKNQLENSGGSPADFYTRMLPQKCEIMKNELGESAFVELYQLVGKNIRVSGNPIIEILSNGKFFTLAQRINDIVKLIHNENKKNSRPTLIVIDAIRSPLEALFFQDRYASFYLVAVSCPDDQRRERLRQIGIPDAAIELIDKQENKSRDPKDPAYFSIQDIPSCLQRADIYITNPNGKDFITQLANLTSQLIRFTSLMLHPGLITPTSVERCMQIATTAKLNSGCISRQVGAAVSDENYSIQSIGWNDAPQGQVPCNLRSRNGLLNGHDRVAFSEYEKNDKEFIEFAKKKWLKFVPISDGGRNIAYCFKSDYNELKDDKNQVHTRSLHAEENAFLQISKNGGRGLKGGKLFTTASPCELCAKKAYQLGIKHIYYIDPYPGIAAKHILQGGSANPQMHLFFGAIGKAFQRLYTPTLPYKDELNALIEGL
jgi:dCMP deaminase